MAIGSFSRDRLSNFSIVDIKKKNCNNKMIYAITNEKHHIKIGYTKRDPIARLRQLQTGSSDRLKLVWLCPSGTMVEEKALHRHFADLRLSGEWFLPEVIDRLSPEFAIN